jgi:Ca-activated chloride channel family protein
VKAHVFSPASAAYLPMLNTAWLSTAGRTKGLVSKSEPLVLSPVVIAMWKPMAEALGWPKKQLSWSDLLKVNASPKGWGSVGFAEWGRFKLGHCHPEFSNSGYLAVLAEAYAGAK